MVAWHSLAPAAKPFSWPVPTLFSPIVGINAPVATAIDVNPVTIVDLHLANVIGSALTAVSQ